MAGFFFIGLLPVCFEAAAEITFPIQETVSTSLLVTLGNIYALVYIILFSVLTSHLLVLGIVLIAMYGGLGLLVLLFRPKYLRWEAEQEEIVRSTETLSVIK